MVSLAVTVACATGALAITPAAYLQNIDATRKNVEILLTNVGRTESGRRDAASENNIIAEIRKELPVSQTVDWPGGTAETSDQWVFDGLERFQKESDTARQAVILTSINQRLDAIKEKVAETQTAGAGNPTKDADKQKLGEILRREEYQKPEPQQENIIRRWVREFFEWLDSLFPRPNLPDAPAGQFSSLKVVMQVLIYAAIIGIVGFLLYRFTPFLAERFLGRAREKRKERVILGERIADDESSQDLFGEAERLARDGDLRGAIRKGYIAVLCELSDRKIIGLARHKTNRDYLRDVARREALLPKMRQLTGSFESSWYGLREPHLADWEDFCLRYREAVAAANAS